MKNSNQMLILLTTLSIFSCGKMQKNSESKVEIKKESTSLVSQTVDAFEKKFGIHEGKRRNHIDGFCFSGNLTIKDEGVSKYSKSVIFSKTPLKVNGRLSHKGGMKRNESDPGEYGMAFRVELIDGGIQDFSMNTLDFFPVNSPEGFHQLMMAKVSGKKEDFAKLKVDHPEFVNFKSHYGAKSTELKTYSNHQFNSVNTFIFENEEGTKTPVRWSFVPKNDHVKLDQSTENDYYLETKKSLEKGNLVWEMVVTIANPGDKVNDASIPWEGEHKQIVVATLTVDGINKPGLCDNMMFNPIILQPGIQISKDPLLLFRSSAYSESFSRRSQEKNN